MSNRPLAPASEADLEAYAALKVEAHRLLQRLHGQLDEVTLSLERLNPPLPALRCAVSPILAVG